MRLTADMPRLGLLLVGLYAWTVTMAFGVTLVDVVYAAQLSDLSAVIQGEVRDFLLGLTALTLLTATTAVAAAWGWAPARYPVVASLAVLVIGLLTPALLSDAIRDVEGALTLRVGPWVRLGEGGWPRSWPSSGCGRPGGLGSSHGDLPVRSRSASAWRREARLSPHRTRSLA